MQEPTMIPSKRKFNSIATLYVGADKSPLFVHLDRLCESSSFFKNAFNSQCKEGIEKKVELPEDEVEVVQLFLQWLYDEGVEITDDPSNRADTCHLLQPMQMLIFADKFDIPNFKVDIFDRLKEHEYEVFSRPSLSAVTYVYQNTCPGSGIRRFLANWYAVYINAPWFDQEHIRQWLLDNPEIAVDFFVAYSNRMQTGDDEQPFVASAAKDYLDASRESLS